MSKSIYRQFWRYTLPTVAAMLVNGLYQVVDGIFIGQYVGSEGLAGINVAWPLVGCILGLGMLVGVGTGALVSIYQGQQQRLKAQQVLSTGLLLLCILSPLVGIGLHCFAEDFLALQGAQGPVFDFGQQYLTILSYSSLFSLSAIAIPFLLRNDHSPQLATWLMVLGAVANIGFDYWFIAYLGWQLQGAAIATALSQALVSLLGIIYFFSPKAQLRLRMSTLRLQLTALPKIFAIGSSSFFMYAYGSAMVALHNGLFAYYGSPLLVGAYAILGYIVTVYYLTMEGIANGMQPLVSYHYGAGKYSNIRKVLKLAMLCSISVGMLFTLLLNLAPELIIALFNDSDPQLMQEAIIGIRLHLFALCLDGFLVVSAAYYQAVNQGRKALFVSIGNMLVQLPFLYFMPQYLGIPGIWLAFPLSNIALSLVVVWMLWGDIQRKLKLRDIQGQYS